MKWRRKRGFVRFGDVLASGGEWRSAKLVIGKTVGPDGRNVINAVNYGNFFGSVVDCMFIAFVVYVMTKAPIKEAPHAPPAPSKNCRGCKEAVAVDATKCKFCTADI